MLSPVVIGQSQSQAVLIVWFGCLQGYSTVDSADSLYLVVFIRWKIGHPLKNMNTFISIQKNTLRKKYGDNLFQVCFASLFAPSLSSSAFPFKIDPLKHDGNSSALEWWRGAVSSACVQVERRLKAEKEAEVTRLTITEVEELSSPDTPEVRMTQLL